MTRGVTAPWRIRLYLAAVALLVGLIMHRGLDLLPWVALVAALDLGATWLLARSGARESVTDAMTLVVSSAVASGVAFAIVGYAASPLLLIPAYHGGLVVGRRALPLVGGSAAVAAAVTVTSLYGLHQLGRRGGLPWLLAGIIFVLLGAWSFQLSKAGEQVEEAAAHEASQLLRRLEELAASMGTGFDAPSLGAVALDDLAHAVKCDRSAVLVADEGWAVPLSLSGATRFPWREPGRSDSVLYRTWHEKVPHTDRFQGGRMREVLTVPLLAANDELLGLIVADRVDTAYGRDDLAAATRVARRVAPALEAAMLFARLRESAALEERTRLAREMHDGLAQDLAALAYQADAAQVLVKRHDPGAEAAVEALRTAIRGVVVDMRSQISELRMVDRPDRSLGALLGTALQSLASTTGVRTTMTLSENRLRFPADVELQLHRLATEVLQDARISRDVTFFELNVVLHPPYAELILRHDGSTLLRSSTFEDSPLARGGAKIKVETDGHHEPVVTVRLGGDDTPSQPFALAGDQ